MERARGIWAEDNRKQSFTTVQAQLRTPASARGTLGLLSVGPAMNPGRFTNSEKRYRRVLEEWGRAVNKAMQRITEYTSERSATRRLLHFTNIHKTETYCTASRSCRAFGSRRQRESVSCTEIGGNRWLLGFTKWSNIAGKKERKKPANLLSIEALSSNARSYLRRSTLKSFSELSLAHCV